MIKEAADTPIVGNIVWYWVAPLVTGQVRADPGPDPEGQPLAAIITKLVHLPDTKEDRAKGDLTPLDLTTRVNLAVFQAHGGHYGRENVTLLKAGETTPPTTNFAEWAQNSEARIKADEALAKKTEDEKAAAEKKAETDAATAHREDLRLAREDARAASR